MSTSVRLRAYLDDVRRRLRRAVWLEGLVSFGWASLAVIAATLLVASFSASRGWMWGLGSAGLVGAVVATLVPAWRRARRLEKSDRDVARYIEQRVPGLYNGFVTAVELGSLRSGPVPVSTRGGGGHSLDLVRGAEEATALRLRSVEPAALIDSAQLFAHLKVAAGVVGAALLVAVLWPGAYGAGWHQLTTAPPVPVAVAPPDERFVDTAARDIRLRYVFPAYTGLGEREVAGSAGDVAALVGTTVFFHARATEPATDAYLEVGEGEEPTLVVLDVSEGGELSGSFSLTENTSYRVRLVTAEGQRVRERLGRVVEVQPDEPPTVVLLLPESDLEVHSEDAVRLAFRARDDYGLAKVELVAAVIGPTDPVRKRLSSLNGERQDQGETTIVVGELGAKPGDAVEVWFEATDQDSVNGPNVGRSESRTIKVWSPREKHKAVVDDLAALAEAMLLLLADRLESPADTAEVTRYQEIITVTGAVNAATIKLVEVFGAVLTAAQEDPLMPPEVLAELVAMRARHDDMQRAEQHTLERIGASLVLPERRVEQLALVRSHHDENVATLEDDIMLLEELVERLREDLLKDQARDMMDKQEELMKLLEELANGDDQAATKALEQIDELQRQLEQMMQEIAKQMKDMPSENFNEGALDPHQQMGDMKDFRDMLEEIKKKIAEGDIEGAMKLAAEMQKAMQQMAAEMDKGMEGFGGMGMSPEQQQQLSELDQEIGELAKKEQEIFDETNQLNEELMEAIREQMKAKMEAFLAKEQDKAKQLLQKLDEADNQSLSEQDKERLQQARDQAKSLQEMLERTKLDQAKRDAEKTAGQCDKLGGSLGESSKKTSDTQKAQDLDGSSKKLGEAGDLAKEIAQDIEDAMPKPQDMLTEEQKQRLKELMEKQAKNKEGLEKLGQKLGEMGEGMPGLPQMMQESLQQAEGEMGQAGEKLGGQQPGPAQGHEQAALEGLGQARRKIKQMLKPSNRTGSGRNVSTEDTSIPQAEDYQVPEEARKEIMKLRRENAPSIFQPLLDRYYEELLR